MPTRTVATATVAIGMGANLGNREQNLLSAWNDLLDKPQIVSGQISSPYANPPLDMCPENWFINAVGIVETTLSPKDLLLVLQRLEKKYGRTRDTSKKGYQDRTIDLDLLLYNDIIIAEKDLTVPHPRLQERLFVLIPLAELRPHWLHPLLHHSIASLQSELCKKANQQVIRQLWPTQLPANCP
jgi:2-amino-4-hydroxy-6-hydroxymethyldihydropteridine diphosphokinase